jgi:AcrR family transcriptional regulator
MNARDIEVFEAFCRVADRCKSHGEIKMSDIAGEVGFSLQNLYKTYYPNLDALISALEVYVCEEILERWDSLPFLDNPELLTDYFTDKILPLIYEKRQFLYTLFGQVADPGFFHYLMENFNPLVSPYMTQASEESGISPETLSMLTVEFVCSAIARWMRKKDPDTVEVFKKKFRYLMEHSVDAILM